VNRARTLSISIAPRATSIAPRIATDLGLDRLRIGWMHGEQVARFGLW